MSKLRSVSTAFWSDPFIEDLTPVQKLLFLYLITNEKTNMLGIYENSIKKISFETGIKKDDVLNALKAFESVGKVKYINNYIILVNYMKHQNYNPNMKKSAIDIYNNLPNDLKASDIIIDKSNPSEGFESLLKCLGMVRKIEVEYEVEEESEDKEEKETRVFNFKNALLDLGIENQIVSDWLKVRTKKRLVNSETAFNAIKLQIEKSNLSAADCIKIAVEKSWGGFEAIWLNENSGKKELPFNQDIKSMNYSQDPKSV